MITKVRSLVIAVVQEILTSHPGFQTGGRLVGSLGNLTQRMAWDRAEEIQEGQGSASGYLLCSWKKKEGLRKTMKVLEEIMGK